MCQGLVAMLLAVPDRLEPSLPDLIEYMLKSTQVLVGGLESFKRCAWLAHAATLLTGLTEDLLWDAGSAEL